MSLLFLVDDHDDTRELLVEWLRMEDFDVQDFRSAEDALAAMKDRTPSVLVTDLMLDGMSGLDLLARVRENPAWAKIPVIACTGRADQSKTETGFTRVLVKPVLPEALSAILRELLAANAT